MRSLVAALVLTLAVTSLTASAHAAPPETPWALARAVLGGDDSAQQTLVDMLESGRPESVARAAKIIRVVGVARPTAFQRILARADVSERGRRAVLADVRNMPTSSPRRASLVAIVERPAAPVADSGR